MRGEAASPAVGDPALSVIVPATDAPPSLRRCLAAIEPLLAPADELIVVREAPGPGPAAARNAGAARARGDVLVFVDSDVVVWPDALARIRGGFAADPGRVAVFGSYDSEPESPGAGSRFRNLLHHHVHSRAAGPIDSFWAGLGAIRRDSFVAVGGFDAGRYPRASIEDVELGRRLAARGMRAVLDPAIRGTHLKRWTPAAIARTDLLDRGAPWVELLVEGRGAGRRALNAGPRHRAGALAALIAVAGAARGRIAPLLAGVGAVVALDASLYGLALRRLGPGGTVIGLATHLVHHLCAALAVPVGAARSLRRRGEPAPGGDSMPSYAP